MILFAVLVAALAPPAEEAAIFHAAGFRKVGAAWHSDCKDAGSASYQAGAIETYRDINQDRRPDAVITEGSTTCYGDTGTRFWLLSKRSDGAWRVMISEVGVPEFYKNKGRGGWPNLSVGGPGFCFPVYRWNGRAYELYTFEYQGTRCKPPEGVR